MAAALFATVCTLVAAEHVFVVALLFGGVRWLGVSVSPLFLLVCLPLLFAFAALYAISLAVTYAIRNGVIAGGVAFVVFVLAAIAGANIRPGFNLQAAAAAVLPRVTSLSEQASRLGGGDPPRFAPFALTAAFAAALFLVTLVIARRSEQ